MRNKNQFLSPVSLFFTFLTLGVVFVGYWQRGGQIFSPGKLSAKSKEGVTLGSYHSHSEFEKKCELCHQPLTSDLATKCLECHVDINSEIQLKEGVHGALVAPRECIACHHDHNGLDFDPTVTARYLYDHSLTRFKLLHHQIDYSAVPISCEACHTGSEFIFNEITCKTCHEKQDLQFMTQHTSDFPLACLDCHDGLDAMVNFDHTTTGFNLAGKHLEIRCAECHTGGKFKGTPTACIGCHQEPDIHLGLFKGSCATCHNTNSWSPATFENSIFDHTQQSGFSLKLHGKDYQGQPINCITCHQSDINKSDIGVCITCHSNHDQEFMAKHEAQFGQDCLSCHDGFDRMHDFDHSKVFALDGRHADITCEKCHVDQNFTSVSAKCVDCHAEPEIHAGSFGLDCQYCHVTDAWTPAQLKMHMFPLDHGSDTISDCQLCHTETYAVYTCYGCHEHQQNEIETKHLEVGIPQEKINECAACHPTGLVKE
jgi:hypothetical protein